MGVLLHQQDAFPDSPSRPLVFVCSVQTEVDVAAVASTIDTQPWIILGDGRDEHLLGLARRREAVPARQMRGQAWACSLHHHRCRTLVCPERPCEGMGSFMRLLWEARQGQIAPGDVADRLQLAQAKVQGTGSSRDEALFEQVAKVLKESRRKVMRPGGVTGLPQRRTAQVTHIEAQVEQSGRDVSQASTAVMTARHSEG